MPEHPKIVFVRTVSKEEAQRRLKEAFDYLLSLPVPNKDGACKQEPEAEPEAGDRADPPAQPDGEQ